MNIHLRDQEFSLKYTLDEITNDNWATPWENDLNLHRLCLFECTFSFNAAQMIFPENSA